MKAILIVFFSLCLYLQSSCQNSQQFDCSIIESLFKVNYVKERLALEKYPNETIILIDTSNFFKNCNLPSIFNRQVIFVSDSFAVREKRPSNFFIYEMSCFKKSYSIGLYSKYTGASIRYKFKMRKGKYIFYKNESGYF